MRTVLISPSGIKIEEEDMPEDIKKGYINAGFRELFLENSKDDEGGK
jgi:hypothetical protein